MSSFLLSGRFEGSARRRSGPSFGRGGPRLHGRVGAGPAAQGSHAQDRAKARPGTVPLGRAGDGGGQAGRRLPVFLRATAAQTERGSTLPNNTS